MAAPSSSSQQAGYTHAYAAERARAVWKSHDARLSTASHRGHRWSERLLGARSNFPGLNSDDLVQQWIDRLTGAAVTDVVGDAVEETAIETMKRAEVYLDHLQRS